MLLRLKRVKIGDEITHLVDSRGRVRATLFENPTGIKVNLVLGDDDHTIQSSTTYVGPFVVVYANPFKLKDVDTIVAHYGVVAIVGSQTFCDVGFPTTRLITPTFRQYDEGDPKFYALAKDLLMHWIDEIGRREFFQ